MKETIMDKIMNGKLGLITRDEMSEIDLKVSTKASNFYELLTEFKMVNDWMDLYLFINESNKYSNLGRLDKTHIWFHDRQEENCYAICIPHDGNSNKWLFRKSKIETFDRWSNCDYEELYNTVKELMEKEL